MKRIVLFFLVAGALLTHASIAQDARVNESVFSATYAESITPSDSAVFTIASRAVYVGGEGDLVVRMARGGATVTFVGIPAGSVLPIAVDMIKTTNTTATSIIVLR